MLTFADRNLHFRHYIPVRLRSVLQIPVRQKFHHRSPEPSQAFILVEPFANGGIQKDVLRDLAGIGVQVRAALYLQEELAGEKLAVRREGLKCSDPGSQPMRSVAGRQEGLPEQTENR